MKKIFAILSLIFTLSAIPCFADSNDLPSSGDLWDSFNKTNDNYKEVKAVSDEDFDKAIEQMKKKKDPIGSWIKKHRTPKGDEQSAGNESEVLENEVETKNTLPVLSLPVELKIADGILPVGHYQVVGEKKENGVVLKLYQAQYLMAEIPAIETQDDFDEDTISFAKWISKDDENIKIIFGSMDFNAYTFLKIHY